MEGSGLQCGEAFADELGAAVDEAGFFGAVFNRAAGDVVVVGFIRLTEVGSVGVGDGALLLHPVQGGGGVESAGEGDADLLAGGKMFEDVGHVVASSLRDMLFAGLCYLLLVRPTLPPGPNVTGWLPSVVEIISPSVVTSAYPICMPCFA